VTEEVLASGDSLIYVRVIFVAAGQRKEHHKQDIYQIAKKMLGSGIIALPGKRSDDG